MEQEISMELSMDKLSQEVSLVLRAADDPNALTFKQDRTWNAMFTPFMEMKVRIEVEKSLGLPEGSLDREKKSMIKKAVHSVMDELEAEGSEGEDDAEESNGQGNGTRLKRQTASEDALPRESKTSKVSKGSKLKGGKRGSKGAVGSEDDRDSKRRKRDMEQDEDGDEDDDEDLDEDVVCLLTGGKSTRKQVSVKLWKGNIQVDIREYYLSKEGDYKPGRKGITLNPVQWASLRSARKTIDNLIKDTK